MSASEKSKLELYQMKSPIEHVLDNPDTYTGSMEFSEDNVYLLNENKIILKKINYKPGFYKLFDECIVNARDHWVRTSQNSNTDNNIPVTNISINISEDGVITMTNDGNGIDIAKHPTHDIWIPEMIFGHLRTSTNYDKDEKKITGGKNGFGVKLIFIWSLWGYIETIDHNRKLKYTQEFKNNLSIIEKPNITKYSKKPYTKISFKPDYERLGLSGLENDILNVFERRIYDIAAVTGEKVKVLYNNNKIPIKNFQQYIDLYIGPKAETSRVYEKCSERWEYGICLAPTEEFTQISFVNGIFTSKGGKHVDYILNQIIKKLTEYIKKKKKIDVKSSTIKEQIMLFIRCDIDNPSFDSQTKDYMNTPMSSFGSKCDISDKFIENIAKLGIMDAACALTQVKENKAATKMDGKKNKSIRGIPKLIDANFAGTDKSNKCILILCEGDSAKAGVVSGLSREQRDIIGVYPMRGKLLNVRGECNKKILENKEIQELKKIIGLESSKKYTKDCINTKLRYNKILFMTDQDLDGSHIKGLCINLFDSEWESLINIPEFLGFMNTPIIKANKQNKEISFYNDGEYENWKKNNDISSWKIKYYKGLGTSTSKEFKEYFENKKIVSFISSGEESKNAIDKVFNKKRSNDRKEWLENYQLDNFLDTNQNEITYEDFINKEMIHFSKYDCERSIPNIMDGFKTSQRKIIYTAFKRNLTKTEIKVAQFSGSVSELSCYHHGEASLNGAIVGMAQNFIGSNNINLLQPKGQFGTRLQGGEDSASERYIYTLLNPITNSIFKKSDDNVLDNLDDDGTLVEPRFYAPIIPMILVNGCNGIGTGFSSFIMKYDPLNIIDYILGFLENKDKPIIQPYYHGFKGTINEIDKSKYLIKGLYKVISPKKIHITELPIGTWTDDYKQFLEKLIDNEQKPGKKESKKSTQIITDYNCMSTDTNIDITVTFANGIIDKMIKTNTEYGCNLLEKTLKLYTTKSSTNMHLFDEKEQLKKFDTPEDIINYFIIVRYNIYKNRKLSQLEQLEKEVKLLSNKARYIMETLDDIIDLRRKKKNEVNDMLIKNNYDIIDNDNDFKYLVKLPMDSVTKENVDKIINERDNKISEYNILKDTSEGTIWINELNELKNNYKTLFNR